MAPVFNANDQDGELWNIADFKDKRYIVAYFYPAALTSGCTKQACSYRDNKSKLNEIDVEIVGISADPVKNLKIFGNIFCGWISECHGPCRKILKRVGSLFRKRKAEIVFRRVLLLKKVHNFPIFYHSFNVIHPKMIWNKFIIGHIQYYNICLLSHFQTTNNICPIQSMGSIYGDSTDGLGR